MYSESRDTSQRPYIATGTVPSLKATAGANKSRKESAEMSDVVKIGDYAWCNGRYKGFWRIGIGCIFIIDGLRSYTRIRLVGSAQTTMITADNHGVVEVWENGVLIEDSTHNGQYTLWHWDGAKTKYQTVNGRLLGVDGAGFYVLREKWDFIDTDPHTDIATEYCVFQPWDKNVAPVEVPLGRKLYNMGTSLAPFENGVFHVGIGHIQFFAPGSEATVAFSRLNHDENRWIVMPDGIVAYDMSTRDRFRCIMCDGSEKTIEYPSFDRYGDTDWRPYGSHGVITRVKNEFTFARWNSGERVSLGVHKWRNWRVCDSGIVACQMHLLTRRSTFYYLPIDLAQ